MVDGTLATDAPQRPPRFVDLLRLRPFAVLYTAETQSIIGDQLARVALSVLVFSKTGNAAATAATYAATMLPAIVGGLFLAGLGDRLPRRTVMVVTDLLRCALVGAMAIPGMALWAIVLLLVIAVLLGPVFSSSEVSYLSHELDAAQFRAATGVRMVTGQSAQVGGFLLGGLAVALVQVRGALLIDSATFAASVLLVGLGLRRPRRVPRVGDVDGGDDMPELRQDGVLVAAATSSTSETVETLAGEPGDTDRSPSLRTLWVDGWLRRLTLLSVLAGFFVVPEGLAVPIGAHLHVRTGTIGILLASMPLGGAIGAALLIRLVPQASRIPIAYWMAVCCGLPLVLTVIAPSWWLVAALWALSGALSAYQVEVISALVHAIPDNIRSRLIGGISAVLLGAQGFGLLVFGAVGEATNAGIGVALAGAAGCICAVFVGQPRQRLARHRRLTNVTA